MIVRCPRKNSGDRVFVRVSATTQRILSHHHWEKRISQKIDLPPNAHLYRHISFCEVPIECRTYTNIEIKASSEHRILPWKPGLEGADDSSWCLMDEVSSWNRTNHIWSAVRESSSDAVEDGLTKYKKHNHINHNRHEDMKLAAPIEGRIPVSCWKPW